MIWFRKHIKIIGLIFLLLLTVAILVAGGIIDNRLLTRRTERPKEVKSSAFGKLTRIGGTGWEVGALTLSFKGTQAGDRNLYLIGEYPDVDGTKRVVQVFVGKIEEDGSVRLLARFLGKNMEEILPRSIKYGDLTNYLSDGDQVQISFLINASDYDKVASETTFCKDLPDICTIGKMTQPFQASYGGFWYDKKPLPAGMALNALLVSKL